MRSNHLRNKKLQRKILSIVLCVGLVLSAFTILPTTAQAANPYLPLWEHIPDAEPHLFHNPDNITEERAYIYGSHDLIRASTYCAYDIVSWSAPESDITDWRYEGPVYTFVRNNNNQPSTLFAPDCAEIKRKVTLKTGVDRSTYQDNQKLVKTDYDDRKYDDYPVFYDKKNDCGYIFDYYLYPHPNGITWVICHSKGSPTGPFEIVNADANSNKLAFLEDGSAVVNNGFDPGVVVDTDADGYATAAYLWWAGFDTIAACKLNMDNMASAEFDQDLADQDTTGKYSADPTTGVPITDPNNAWYGVKRNFLPVAGVSSYSNVAAWAIEDNINPVIPGKKKFDVLDPENLDLYRIFEASTPRKIGNKWVFGYSGYAGPEYGAYSSNATLKYAYSDNPLGPWKYGGMMIDARGPQLDQNGNMMTTNSYGNTHGGLLEANNQWYIFYHRCINQNEASRQHMAEPVYLKADDKPVADGGKVVITAYDPATGNSKTLKDVNGNVYSGAEVTSSGTQLDGLNPYQYYSAGIASWLTPERTVTNVPTVPAPDFITYIQATYDMHEDAAPILNIRDGSIMGYKYFNFDTKPPAGKSTTLDMYFTPKGVDFTIDIMLDTPWAEGTPNAGKKIGELSVPASAEQVRTKYTVSVPALDNVKGRHGIYFVCKSDNTAVENCQFSGFAFGRQDVLLADSFANLDNWKNIVGATVAGGVLTLANNAGLTSKKGDNWQDYEFVSDVESITGNLSIQFMKSSASKYYELDVASDGKMTLNTVNGAIREKLAETEVGVFKAPTPVSISTADGVIKVRLDGVLVMRAENDDYDYGAVGFATGGSSTAKIGSVLVSAATDLEVATSDMKIMVDGVSIPLPNSMAATVSNAYTDCGNYDFTYAHGNTNAPAVTATCSDKNVKISVTQPTSATDMAIVRADKAGYTKTFRIKLAKGKTVTGTINPVKGGVAYPGGVSQDILDDIMAGQDLTGNWRLDVSVIVDNALKGSNYNDGTKAGVSIFGDTNNYYQVSARRHATASNVTQAQPSVGYVIGGTANSATSGTYAADQMVNTMTYDQLITYNLRITKNGNTLLGSSNNSSEAYTNQGTAQTFAASFFTGNPKVQLFATNTTANKDLKVKYVATLITEDYVNTNDIVAGSKTGTIAPEKNGKAYGDSGKAMGDIKTLDLSNIAPEILAGDWSATVVFTTTPTLQTSNSDIQVGVGLSGNADPDKNFFQAHVNRNGTANNYVGGVTYARDSATPTNDNYTPSATATSTLATHTVRLTKIGNTLRGAYITTGTTWANIGGPLATKFPAEFFKDAKLDVFATNGTNSDFAVSNYSVTFAMIKAPIPVTYNQLAVEDAAVITGNGTAVKDTDPGATDLAKAQAKLNNDAGLNALGVTATISGSNAPYSLTITKGKSSVNISPFTVLNVDGKGWSQFSALKTVISGLNETTYTTVSWTRLQKALAAVAGIKENSGDLAIGLAFDKLTMAQTALETASTAGVITADGLNDGGYTKADSVAVTITQSGTDTISSATLKKNGTVVTPSGYIASGTPFNVSTADEGLYYVEATTSSGKTSDFGFIVDKTKPVISYASGTKKLTVSDDNLMFVTINGQSTHVTGKTYTVTLATDQYEISAEDKAGNSFTYASSAVDKTELKNAISAALQFKAANDLVDYTTGTVNEFNNALSAAQTLNENATARQVDIDSATARLTKSMAGFVSRVRIKKAIEDAEALDVDDYMQFQVRYQTGSAGNTTTNFLIELENCKMMYERPNYTQANLDWAEGRLRTIMSSLVSRVPLRDALARAQDILDNSSEAYSSGSISALQTAVNTATTFYNQRTTATSANVTTQTNNVNNAVNNLVPPANTFYLELTVKLYENRFKENETTGKAWTDFAKAIKDARDMIAKPRDYSQAQVNAAQKAIEDTAKVIQANPISTLLLEIYIGVSESYLENEDLYIISAVNALKAAVDEAKDVLATRESQAKVDAASDKLIAVMDTFYERGDLAPLSALISYAGTLTENDYTTESWKAVTDALKIADKVVLKDKDASIYDVEYGYDSLLNAILGLKDKVVLNYHALDTAIARAQNIITNSDKYIASSITGLSTALTAATNVKASATTQKQLDDATVALATAIAKAKLKADLSGLQSLMAKVESLDLSLYTEESAGLVKSLMAKSAKLTEEDIQQTVDNAAYELSAAINALEKKPVAVTSAAPSPSKSDTNTSSKTPSKSTDKATNSGSKRDSTKDKAANTPKGTASNTGTSGSTSGNNRDSSSSATAPSTGEAASGLPTVPTGSEAGAAAATGDIGTTAPTTIDEADGLPMTQAGDQAETGGFPLNIWISLLLATLAIGAFGFVFIKRRHAKGREEK